MSQVIVVNNSLKIANNLCDILEQRDITVIISFVWRERSLSACALLSVRTFRLPSGTYQLDFSHQSARHGRYSPHSFELL